MRLRAALCLVLALWLTATAAAAELRDVVVRIRNQEAGGVSSLGSGTVVALGDGSAAVLSCAHLFRDGVGRLTVYLPTGEALPARLVKHDRENDLSLLAVDGPLPEPAQVDGAHAARGAVTWAAGYGQAGQYRQYGGQVIGYIGGHLAMQGAARSGDSGGPIFNERGELTGVLWGTDGDQTLGTPAPKIRALLSGVTETQCYGGSCPPNYGYSRQGRVGIGVEWNRQPVTVAPSPRRQAPAAQEPPLVKVAPPAAGKPCDCDAASLKAEVAALSIEINRLRIALAKVEQRPEPTQITAAEIEAAIKRQPLRAQIIDPAGKVLSSQQTYLGGEPLRFQLRPKEVVRK